MCVKCDGADVLIVKVEDLQGKLLARRVMVRAEAIAFMQHWQITHESVYITSEILLQDLEKPFMRPM